jgi:hypothetical protein
MQDCACRLYYFTTNDLPLSSSKQAMSTLGESSAVSSDTSRNTNNENKKANRLAGVDSNHDRAFE